MLYTNISIKLVSPDKLRLPDFLINEFKKNNISILETQDIKEGIADVDIIYMTRIQEERFKNVSEANKYIDGQAPWSLANKNKDRMGEILAIMTEVIRNIAIFLQPIIPESANKILNQLKIPDNERTFNFSCSKYRLSKNITIDKPYPVFPRYFET